MTVKSSRLKVRVEVSDPGGGFDDSAVPPPSIFQQSGWGLFLVGEVADDWGVTHDRATVVWFEIDLRTRSETS